MLRASYIFALTVILFAAPVRAEAAVQFGGQIQAITYCLNDGIIHTVLSPPRGGQFLWSPLVTDTYAFGPPRRTGQWLLGNAGPSHFCIVSVLPWDVRPGLLMMTMGSSQ